MIYPFNKWAEKIQQKQKSRAHGLYRQLLFPIAFTFSVTFISARLINHAWPHWYLEFDSGLHIHHFTYGVFMLAIAGYLALIFNGPRAKTLIAGLLGVGLGFVFDEFALWLRLNASEQVRWSYEGLVVVMGLFGLILSIEPGLRLIKKYWK